MFQEENQEDSFHVNVTQLKSASQVSDLNNVRV